MDTRFLALLFTSSAAVGTAVWFATPHLVASPPPMPVVTGPPSPESPSAAAPSAPRERSTAPSAKPRIKAPARTPPRLYAPTAPSVLRPREAAEPQTGVYYSGCREARAAGAAPIYRGQPGYRPEMDGDGDGIACESRF